MDRYFVFFGSLLLFLFCSAVFVWSIDQEAWRILFAGTGFSCSLFLLVQTTEKVVL